MHIFTTVSSSHTNPLSEALLCTLYRWPNQGSGKVTVCSYTASQYVAEPGSTFLISEALGRQGLPAGSGTAWWRNWGTLGLDIQGVMCDTMATREYGTLSAPGAC